MSMRTTLTACILAKDEEAVIRRVIESVKPLADEVLVGDTGSRDRTRALAAEAGARVVEIPWRDDFAAARNELMAQAAGDWVLWLDADEVLEADGRQWLQHHLGTLPPGPYCALIRFASDPGTFPRTVLTPRQGWRYRGRIHERLEPETPRPDVEQLLLPQVIVRNDDSHRADRNTPAKRAYYLAQIEAELAADPAQPHFHFHAGHTLILMQQPAQALERFRQGLSHAADPSAQIHRLLLLGALQASRLLDDAATAAAYGERLLAICPDYAEARQAVAQGHQRAGRVPEAVRVYLELAELLIGTRFDTSLPTQGAGLLPGVVRAVVDGAMAGGDWRAVDDFLARHALDFADPYVQAARLHFRLKADLVEDALGLHAFRYGKVPQAEMATWLGRPMTDPYVRQFTRAELWSRLGAVPVFQNEALAVLDGLAKAFPQDGRTLALQGTILFRMGQFDRAVGCLEEALRRDGEHPGLLNNLAYCLQQLGRIGEAEKHLRRVLTLAPDFEPARQSLAALLAARQPEP